MKVDASQGQSFERPATQPYLKYQQLPPCWCLGAPEYLFPLEQSLMCCRGTIKGAAAVALQMQRCCTQWF